MLNTSCVFLNRTTGNESYDTVLQISSISQSSLERGQQFKFPQLGICPNKNCRPKDCGIIELVCGLMPDARSGDNSDSRGSIKFRDTEELNPG